eukprot:m.155050 g.155050  ORF g.155050 m.155050 type:complete len:442 (+) comp38652_c0_seq1:59-1384(+)
MVVGIAVILLASFRLVHAIGSSSLIDQRTGPKNQAILEYAELFNVSYQSYYKVVTSKGLGCKGTYVLYEEGWTKPTDSFPNATFIGIPIQSAAVKETTSLGFFEILGQIDSIAGFLLSEFAQDKALDVVTSPCFRKRLEKGVTTEHKVSDSEAAHFDARFISPFDCQHAGGNRTVILNPISEKHPVGRAEWIKFISLFYNAEESANDLFKSISNKYTCLKDRVAKANRTRSVRVAWFDEYGSTFYASSSSYIMEYVKDAGGMYVNNCTNRSFGACQPNELETTLEQVDVVLTTGLESRSLDGFVQSLKKALGVTDVNPERFPALRSGALYNVDKRHGEGGGLDWFEGSIVEPDVVLLDLVSILSPDVLGDRFLGGFQRVYLRNIDGEEKTSLGSHNCTDVPRWNAGEHEACSGDARAGVSSYVLCVLCAYVLIRLYGTLVH